MSSKSFQQIQQIGDDDKVIDCSCCTKIKNSLLKNEIIGQLDDFSINIKFLNNGEESFKTVLSGLCYLILLVGAVIITYFFAFPSTLNTTITQTTFFTENQVSGTSIFDHVSQPFSFSIVPASSAPIPSQFMLRIYYFQKKADRNITTQLQFDTNCKNGNFCLTKNVNKDKNLQIYGNSSDIISGKIVIEMVWCNGTTVIGCPALNYFAFTLYFENTMKQREKILVPITYKYEILTVLTLAKLYTYDIEIIRQTYTSNSKFWGHLANIFPQTLKTYYITTAPLSAIYNTFQRVISMKRTPQQVIVLTFTLRSAGKTNQIKQNFYNILNPIIFLLALIDPLCWVLKNFFLNNYNRNCRDLFIGDKLYYIQDKKNHEKFNFSTGSSVFFVCFFYRNPVFLLFEKIIKIFGKNLIDILPIKSIHTISMINQGAQVMSENIFFGTIEQFTNLEEGQAKKTVLQRYELQAEQNQEEEDELETQYFPDKPIQKLAFDRFCADNNYITIKRRNKAYQILLDKKYSTCMKDGFHKQFDTYVRDINRLKKQGKVLQLIGDNNIPVDLVEREEETNVGLRND